MKVLTYKTAMLVCWLLAIGLPTLHANTSSEIVGKEFKKTIKKEFPISSDGTVDLFNKFGELNVQTWDKNQVKIDVTITVNAGSQSDADEVFDRINVKFSNRSDYVKAETEISSSRKSSWWGSSSKSDFDIDYVVYMPKSAQLDLKIHHGDASIGDLDGNAKLVARHSDLDGETFNGKFYLNIAHGDAEILRTQNAHVDVAHGDFKLKDTKTVEIEGRHSDINIRNAGRLKGDFAHSDLEFYFIANMKLDTKHDDLEIKQVGELIMDAKYSDVEIEFLEKRANCDMQFGDLNVDRIAANFDEIRLNGAHTDFDLRIEDGASYKLDAAGSHGDIDYPSGMTIKYEKDKSSSQEVRGHMGNANASSIIHVRMAHGDLDISN